MAGNALEIAPFRRPLNLIKFMIAGAMFGILALSDSIAIGLLGAGSLMAIMFPSTYLRRKTPAFEREWLKYGTVAYGATALLAVISLFAESLASSGFDLGSTIFVWMSMGAFLVAFFETYRVVRYHFNPSYRPVHGIVNVSFGVYVTLVQAVNGYLLFNYFSLTMRGAFPTTFQIFFIATLIVSYIGAGKILYGMVEGKRWINPTTFVVWFLPYLVIMALVADLIIVALVEWI